MNPSAQPNIYYSVVFVLKLLCPVRYPGDTFLQMSERAIERGTLSDDAEKSVVREEAIVKKANLGHDFEGNIVDFDGPSDPSNPLNWSFTYKWTIVWLLSAMNLIV